MAVGTNIPTTISSATDAENYLDAAIIASWIRPCRGRCQNCRDRASTTCGVEEMARLTGKVALITGASGGQGAAEAELFVREEAAVVLTDIDTAAGEALAQRLGRQGGSTLFLRQDVADEASWKETVSAA